MFVFKRAPLAVTRDLFYVAIRLLIHYMYHLRGNYFMQSELFFMIALIYRHLCQCHACKLKSSVIEQFGDDMNMLGTSFPLNLKTSQKCAHTHTLSMLRDQRLNVFSINGLTREHIQFMCVLNHLIVLSIRRHCLSGMLIAVTPFVERLCKNSKKTPLYFLMFSH